MKWNRAAFAEQMVSHFGRERWNEHVKLLAGARECRYDDWRRRWRRGWRKVLLV